MNRFIGKIDNGKIKIITLTSGEPKKTLINFIFQFQNSGGLKKCDINKQIKKTANRYYYNEYFISRGTNNE